MAVDVEKSQPTVQVTRLKFTYLGIDGHSPPGAKPLIGRVTVDSNPIPSCGLQWRWENDILKIIGGKHMVEQETVRVLERSAFHGTALTAFGDLSYLGGEVLGINLSWRMHKVSDGQRRRVQICMGLLKTFKVLLLDEITVDLFGYGEKRVDM